MAIRWTVENASQESVNAWTHGIGFLASLPGGLAIAMIAGKWHADMIGACLVYTLSLSAMYLFSTLSHAIRDPRWRHRARAWDQGAIYLLIAGTYTPFIWAYMDEWSRALLLLGVWISAALGCYSKVVAGHRLNNMTAISYVLLGWIPSMWLIGRVTWLCFATMALGGVLYTVGTRFLQNDHKHWTFHPIWHILVILASVCHYVAIVLFPIMNLDR